MTLKYYLLSTFVFEAQAFLFCVHTRTEIIICLHVNGKGIYTEFLTKIVLLNVNSYTCATNINCTLRIRELMDIFENKNNKGTFPLCFDKQVSLLCH